MSLETDINLSDPEDQVFEKTLSDWLPDELKQLVWEKFPSNEAEEEAFCDILEHTTWQGIENLLDAGYPIDHDFDFLTVACFWNRRFDLATKLLENGVNLNEYKFNLASEACTAGASDAVAFLEQCGYFKPEQIEALWPYILKCTDTKFIEEMAEKHLDSFKEYLTKVDRLKNCSEEGWLVAMSKMKPDQIINMAWLSIDAGKSIAILQKCDELGFDWSHDLYFKNLANKAVRSSRLDAVKFMHIKNKQHAVWKKILKDTGDSKDSVILAINAFLTHEELRAHKQVNTEQVVSDLKSNTQSAEIVKEKPRLKAGNRI